MVYLTGSKVKWRNWSANLGLVLIWALLTFGLSACGVAGGETRLTATPTESTLDGSPSPTGTPSQGTAIYQWASDAGASSEYADPEWSAQQATGPPDAPGCGDYQYAWASAASDSIATLTVTYSIPVYPTEVQVVESFHPDQVVKVEVLTPEGDSYTVYENDPQQVDRPCPYTLSVQVGDVPEKVDRVRITVDQSVLGLGWNEIDAVQLIGGVERESGG